MPTSVDLNGNRRLFEEVLSEALQHAASLVDRHFFGGVEAAGHRHVDAFAVLAMDHQRQVGARRALTDHVVGFAAVDAQSLAVSARFELQRQHAHAHQVGAVNALETFGGNRFHPRQTHAFGRQSRDEPWP